jgi:hypothetical protein
MNWLYAGVFGLILLGFIAYGFKLFKEDKKIINEYQDQMDGQSLGGDNLSEEEVGILDSERPFIQRFESYN